MVGLLSEPGPVGLHVALVVAVQRTEHPRPGKKRWPSPVGGRGNNRMPYETPAPTAAALSVGRQEGVRPAARRTAPPPARRSHDTPIWAFRHACSGTVASASMRSSQTSASTVQQPRWSPGRRRPFWCKPAAPMWSASRRADGCFRVAGLCGRTPAMPRIRAPATARLTLAFVISAARAGRSESTERVIHLTQVGSDPH